ncbi:MAG: hypothetical protein ACFFAY_06635 [Promethearchaeota archaeon]
MMGLEALVTLFIVSIILCAVGAELVRRYRPNMNKMYIHFLHAIYGVGVVILFFAL